MRVHAWQVTCGVSWTWVMSILICLIPRETLGEKERDKCTRAQEKCVSRVGCGMALHNYFMNCGSLIYRDTDVCSLQCQNAIISLLSTEDQEGANFMDCDCEGQTVCVNHRKRIEICSHNVMRAMASVHDDTTDISCSLAELICRADTSCYTALSFYERHCTKLFKGEKCSARCNNSLSILYRQVKARKLRTCVCDGTEEYPCEAIQSNTETLCLGSSRRRKHRHRGHHNHHSNQTHTTGTTVRNNENIIARQQKNKASAHSPSNSVHYRQSSFIYLLILLMFHQFQCR